MKAFYKDGDFLAKAYDQNDDWQVMASGDNITLPENWASTGRCIGANLTESLTRAIQRSVESNGLTFDESKLVIC